MLYFVSLSRSQCGKLFYLSCAVIACLLVIKPLTGCASEGKNTISAVSAHITGNDLTISLRGSTAPTYTVFELFKPSRIVVDVANSLAPSAEKVLLPEELKVKLTTQSITDSQPKLTRFEFTFDHSYPFTTSDNNNEITILVKNFAGNETKKTPVDATRNMPSVASQLPAVNPMKAAIEKPVDNAAAAMENNFNFSGYNKEHITVDFYKIDLHNVFRLIRDVSGVNIVVDEAVEGSLTLALNDVPWDFALDIILNLKDLAKEERFNTIVIHPKEKDFSWPERAVDNLSFEADEEMIVQESLTIQKEHGLPANVVEAKKLIAKAGKLEKKGDAEQAVKMYEAAHEKWPHNSKILNKIAAIYLVQLHQNAKAAYFADKALHIDKHNNRAALNAAIAYANMHEDKQAQRLFDQSVSEKKPTKEALLSYAAFSENQSQLDGALQLLKKYDAIYGNNVDSMIAEARILDKMGKHNDATEAYQAILLAGFRIPPDLKKFILDRKNRSQSF